MTSHAHDSAETRSPEGLYPRLSHSCCGFFLLRTFVVALDDVLPLPEAFASSAMSFSLSFGLSILHKSDGMESGRFDPLYVFTRRGPSQWQPSGMGFPVGVILISKNISTLSTASVDLSIASSLRSVCSSVCNSDWNGIGRGSAMTSSWRRSGLGSLASCSARCGTTNPPAMSSTRLARCMVVLPFSAW